MSGQTDDGGLHTSAPGGRWLLLMHAGTRRWRHTAPEARTGAARQHPQHGEPASTRPLPGAPTITLPHDSLSLQDGGRGGAPAGDAADQESHFPQNGRRKVLSATPGAHVRTYPPSVPRYEFRCRDVPETFEVDRP